MRSSKVLIAVPTRGAVRNETISRLDHIREANDIGPILFCSGRLSSHETRNELAKGFMQGDWDVIVMCDDDIVPPVNMLDLLDSIEEFGIVACAAPCFQPKVSVVPLLMAYEHVPEHNTYKHLDSIWTREGVVECDAVGFGCVAIHRRVFEAMEYPYFRMEYNDAGSITDDMTFCKMAREAGFRVAMNFDLQCEHFSMVKLFELAKGIFALVSDITAGTDEQNRLISERNGGGAVIPLRADTNRPCDFCGEASIGQLTYDRDDGERATKKVCLEHSKHPPDLVHAN